MKGKKYHNWAVDEKTFRQADRKGYHIWQLEQALNYGTDSKISQTEIKKNWHKLTLEPDIKKYLKFILWPKKS